MNVKQKSPRRPSMATEPELHAWADLSHLERVENARVEKETVTLDGITAFMECVMDHAVFQGDGRTVLFADVVFDGCDLSNLNLDEAVFRRCEFKNCRMLGTSFIRAVFQDITMTGCVCDYANFSGSKWRLLSWQNCRFREASLNMCEVAGPVIAGCDFQSAEIAGTKLAGWDLSDSFIGSLAVRAEDLKGVTVNRDQAAALAGLFGNT